MRRTLTTTLLTGLLLAGCGGGAAEETTVPTTAAPSTAAVTTTLVSTTPTTAASAWDVVALGDSLVAGWGVRPDQPYTPEEAFPGVYARSLAEELGIETVR